jgi:diguanylate cyclase (GGDEF)-like protein
VAAAGLAAAQDPYTTELSDGRHLAVALEPISNGGWVTTHQDITELRRSEATISYMASHDALTGLPNRTLFGKQLEEALRQARPGATVAQHLLDLDHFKHVNDTLGHAAGDRLLIMVTQRLRALFRAGDVLARMGGDEFAILQTNVGQAADAAQLARRVIEQVGQNYDIGEHQVVTGTSIGIALAGEEGCKGDLLMRNADLALYKARADGRGALRFFEPEMDAEMQARRSMERDLRVALAQGQFELNHQPSVDLLSNEIPAFEALIRWRHPDKGLVPPSQFIGLAEEIGAIVALGEWALKEACAAAAGWPASMEVAVNLSALQFRSPGLVDVVVCALGQSGLAAERLELEISRGHSVARQRNNLGDALRLTRAGRADFHGRLRHGLLLAQLSAELPFRQNQDRPVFRGKHHRERQRHQYRARDYGHGQGARHDDHGGGR